MSVYAYCISACISCGQLFSYNPHYVPATRYFTGEREPICRACITLTNAKRKSEGLEPFFVHPQAYQPCPEEEL